MIIANLLKLLCNKVHYKALSYTNRVTQNNVYEKKDAKRPNPAALQLQGFFVVCERSELSNIIKEDSVKYLNFNFLL